MKKIGFYVLLSVCLLGTFSCKEQTYASELKEEQKLIDAFIARNNINVLHSWPKDSVFRPDEYILLDSGLYFQLVNKGQGKDTAMAKDIIVYRHKRYALTEYADTISSMLYDYPPQFVYGNTQDGNACQAFHEAVSYMKRNNSEANFIVPSKLGFSSDMRPATPYGYYMKIKIKK